MALRGPQHARTTTTTGQEHALERGLRLRELHALRPPAGLHAREAIRSMSGQNHTFYCGAHLGNGFHEDGVVSGLAIRRTLDGLQEAA